MNGLVEGIYRICNALKPVTLAILILMLVVNGISTLIGGAESHGRTKESLKYMLFGAAIAFGATAIGQEIATWFMQIYMNGRQFNYYRPL